MSTLYFFTKIILQDFDTCSMLISLFISLLQGFGTYMSVLMSIAKSGKLLSTLVYTRIDGYHS
jgi:hypothetical protein